MNGNVYNPNNSEKPNSTPWDTLSEQPAFEQKAELEMSKEQYSREREKELEYVLLTKDFNQLGKFAEGFSERDERQFYEHVLRGGVSYDDEMAVMKSVRRPDEMGIKPSETLGRIQSGSNVGDKTRAFFLANGGSFGEYGEYNVPSRGVENILNRCETALDFVGLKDTVVETMVRGASISRERASTAFDDVCEDIYGMQGEYANTLVRIATRTMEYANTKEHRPIWEDMNSKEKLFTSAAVCVTSKEQLRDGSFEQAVNTGFEDGSSQDAAYGSGKDNVFAVFDGVGGSEDGRAAARKCMEKLPEFMDDLDNFTTPNGKKMLIDALNGSIEKGGTTGVITKIVQDENGKKFLHYVSVGDSRLYIVRKNGISEQITNDDNFKDEDAYAMAKGYLRMEEIAKLRADAEAGKLAPDGSIDRNIQNYMLHGVTKSMDGKHRISPSEGNAGVVALESGDQIVLCSDGITGDVPKERMFTSVIDALIRGRDANTSVMHLMNAAAKFDDRTAIVVNV